MPLLRLLPWLLATCLTACSGGPDINVFPVQQDVQLGQQTVAEILQQPDRFPVLSPDAHPAVYAYVQGMVDEIVATGEVAHADVFPYRVTLIDQPVDNAFAAPGGYLFVYTGLLKSLAGPDQLAGVLAHEIAHAAERHSTQQATKRFGLATLERLLTGADNSGILAQIAGQLINLGFSRADEAEADARSVDYLCGTPYATNGAAGFFEQVESRGGVVEFLSTHPSPQNRVAKINARAADLECAAKQADAEAFRRLLQQL
ncbi:putative Zn-dependent protease [Lewinella marina]|uniref:Peptidase M48 n=1 Tax=Neolewinella marina TaxID=438751 RepID=A0A2G0CK63_9BACT|nr:M48 family metalloprotease [Neolewinella marina]NJB84443.1 putative Zn-dependent protease [Neolewinella marina]PHL00364.1 peptidase M48 [Neolewinella marina]